PPHLQLSLHQHAQNEPALTYQYVTDAVGRFGNADDETFAALAAWLNRVGRARKTLELLPLDRAVNRQDLFLQHISALAALERWDEVKEILSSERIPVEPVFQYMYRATARTVFG